MTSTQRPDRPSCNASEDVSGPGLEIDGVLAALRRAAIQARRIAQQTGTDLIVMRDGKVVRVPPEQVVK